jgi:hypothetical protein
MDEILIWSYEDQMIDTNPKSPLRYKEFCIDLQELRYTIWVILQLNETFCWELVPYEISIDRFAYDINNFIPFVAHTWR